MTEEELANMSDEEFAEYENSPEATPVEEELSDEVTLDEPEVIEDAEVDDESIEVDEEDSIDEPEASIEDTNSEDELVPDGDTEDTPDETNETTEGENAQADSDSSEYKTYYELIMAPIKANGQEITIKSPEDARTLIQKGLNYDDKMVAIKPVRLAGKALEKAGIIRDGIIDENALNRMIDFNNGNIEVVKARLKELNIDPLDLDLDTNNYEATDYVPDEHTIELDDIQRELDSRGSTEQVVTALNRMDDESREFFNERPKDLLALEADISNGVFDEIYGNVQYERRMGRLDGVSDMDAYIHFAKSRGDQMREVQNSEAPSPTPTKTVNAVKRAKAGGSRAAVNTATAVVNPFDLSDEEFEKQFGTTTALR